MGKGYILGERATGEKREEERIAMASAIYYSLNHQYCIPCGSRPLYEFLLYFGPVLGVPVLVPLVLVWCPWCGAPRELIVIR